MDQVEKRPFTSSKKRYSHHIIVREKRQKEVGRQKREKGKDKGLITFFCAFSERYTQVPILGPSTNYVLIVSEGTLL